MLNTWDKSNKEKPGKKHEEGGLHMYMFKHEPLVENITQNVASHDFYTLAVHSKFQSKGL